MANIQPIASNLNRQQAAHLLRRATFGPTVNEINDFTGLSVDAALTRLLEVQPVPELPIDPQTGITWLPVRTDLNSGNRELIQVTKSWWLNLMRTSGPSLTEKMVFYYHTHFTTISTVVNNASALYYQNALFRYYALGNYKELAYRICLDNAMLIFLDGRDNVEGLPQENFAREFLELYTIGKGPEAGAGDYTNYTEQDVQAAAKVLSGYDIDKDFLTIDPITGLPTGQLKGNNTVASRHDASTKVFSNRLQNAEITPTTVINGSATKDAATAELQELVDLLFNQDETAKFICRKLYRYFMYYEINDEIEQDIIVPLANTLRTNNYEIQSVLEQLLKSEHFYDLDNTLDEDDLQGAIIKSPLEITIGTLRFFNVEFPEETNYNEFYNNIYQEITDLLTDQGLDLLEPYEVAGYPAYHQYPDYNRNWISANYLGNRYLYINELISGIGDLEDFTETIQIDSVKFVEDNVLDPTDSDSIVRLFVDYLLPEIITTERYNYFRDFVLLDDLSPVNWAFEWQTYESTGDDMAVRQQLNSLCIAVMQSPEYQLH